MYSASFESFLKPILIILLIYFGFKLFIKYFGPMILKFILKRLGRKFQQQFHSQPKPSQTKSKNKVTIDKKPSNSRKSNKKVGEYIDYEEID